MAEQGGSEPDTASQKVTALQSDLTLSPMPKPHEEGEGTLEPLVVERKKKTTLCSFSGEFFIMKLSTYSLLSLIVKLIHWNGPSIMKQCVLATIFPSERVFSTSGSIVPCRRASLKPDTVDRLVFLSQSLQ